MTSHLPTSSFASKSNTSKQHHNHAIIDIDLTSDHDGDDGQGNGNDENEVHPIFIPCEFCGLSIDFPSYSLHLHSLHRQQIPLKFGNNKNTHNDENNKNNSPHPMEQIKENSTKRKRGKETSFSSTSPSQPSSSTSSSLSPSLHLSPFPPFPISLHGPSETSFSGLFYALSLLLSSLSSTYDSFLCDDFDFHYRNRNDFGWGCGYKNIQHQLSAIYKYKFSENKTKPTNDPSPILLPPSIPTVREIQLSIDFVHKDGFDIQAYNEIGNIMGTRKWIGATECYSLLTACRINAQIADFELEKSEEERKKKAKTKIHQTSMKDFVESKGISSASSSLSSSSSSSSPSSSSSSSRSHSLRTKPKFHHRLIEFVWKYFFDQRGGKFNSQQSNRNYQQNVNTKTTQYKSIASFINNNTSNSSSTSHSTHTNDHMIPNSAPPPFCPPLFFQHNGHSRSIIGILRHRITQERSLLVIDPDAHSVGGGERLFADIYNKQSMASLVLPLERLSAPAYQIVCVRSAVMLSDEEMRRRKVIFADHFVEEEESDNEM